MMKRSRSVKKHTIFKIFLFPLIAIMMLQSLLTVGTLALRRTFGMIQDYSVDMMCRTVENRKIMLENEMIQRWSAIKTYDHAINGMLESYLSSEEVTLEQVLSDDKRCNELLELFFPDCLEILQNNLTSGIFVILTDGDMTAPSDHNGFFVRDSEPAASNPNNTDMLLERGNKDFSRSFGVPLDSCWSTRFHMAGKGQRRSDRFFYEPWRAGMEHPDAAVSELGYWSEPFILEDDENDAHEMITYSVPLLYEGHVYAVLGVEISTAYLKDLLPDSELNDDRRSGYMLAHDRGDGDYQAVTGEGMLYNAIVTEGGLFHLDETSYRTLFEVDGVKIGRQGIYAVRYPLNLYNRYAPYENTQWVLMGLDIEEDLFGISRELYVWFIIAILIGLVFGAVGIYVTVLHLTKPIKKLMECISNGLNGFEASGIWEIDALYGVIDEMNTSQKKAEDALLEEKERYRIAVESSTDTFFSYDMRDHQVDVVNHERYNGSWKCGEEGFIDLELVASEDQQRVRDFFRDIPDKAVLEFRMRIAGEEKYTWIGLYGKVICDAEGQRFMLVGVLRNIQELKQQEEEQLAKLTKDGATGLCAYRAGMEELRKCRERQPEGILAYLHIGSLLRLINENGVVFGDLLLERIGYIIRDLDQTVAFRYNASEIVIWLERCTPVQARAYADGLLQRIEGMFDREMLSLDAHAGLVSISGETDDMRAIRMARLAEEAVSREGTGAYVFYDQIPASERDRLPEVRGRQIISNDYGEEIPLSSIALGLFSRGTNLPVQMVLILSKLGWRYGAQDVLITILRQDFSTNYVEYQWHQKGQPLSKNTEQYAQEEWRAFQKWVGREQILPVTLSDSADPVLQKFLSIKEGQQGIVLPLYDNGSYTGNLCVAGIDPTIIQDADEAQKITEVAGIVQSQLNQQLHDLASKAKSDFLSRMSHEIRTPMNGIMGMTAIAMQEDQSDERIQDCLSKIQSSSQYLLGIINDILDMSKIESGKMHLDPQNFDIQDMLDTVREVVRPQMEAKKIEFSQEIGLINRWFSADRMRISQVLINLLGNAAKFTPEHGRVRLTVREDKGDEGKPCLYFEVRDTGIGISKENQERVFRAFEQEKGAAAVSKQQGTGLGLSISRRLVQLMGSDIELESEPGEGSSFSFAIGLELGKDEDGLQEQEEGSSFEGFRVLVVEDNELNAEIAQCLLEDQGFEVDHVSDGLQAVNRMRETAPHTYDIILMDIMMPVMDGLDATRNIRGMDRADCKAIPIIAMSANAFDDDLKKSVECGMNGHLSKPVEVDKLYKMLRDTLCKREKMDF